MVKHGLCLKFTEIYSAVIRDRCEDYVNFGDLAKVVRKKPAELWSEYCLILGEINNTEELFVESIVPRLEIISLTMDDFFYLDSNGRVVDENGQRTGFSVNGPNGKSVGGWEDIFVPLKLAKEIANCETITNTTWEDMHPESQSDIE